MFTTAQSESENAHLGLVKNDDRSLIIFIGCDLGFTRFLASATVFFRHIYFLSFLSFASSLAMEMMTE